jgi:hypothetical protein
VSKVVSDFESALSIKRFKRLEEYLGEKIMRRKTGFHMIERGRRKESRAIGCAFAILAAAVFLISLSACGHRESRIPTIREEISDPSSPLIDVLLRRSDFSLEFNWLRDDTREPGDLADASSDVLGSARRGIAGYFGDTSYVSFFHVLKLYTGQLTSEDANNYVYELVNAHGDEELLVQVPSFGRYMDIKCVRHDPGLFYTTRCRVIVVYEHIQSEIFLQASDEDDHISRENIELMLEEALVAVDSRIREIDERP